MRGAKALDEGLVVAVELKQHVAGGHKLLVVIGDALQLGDVADGADGGATYLANALGDGVGDGKNLIGVLVEQKVVVAEMGSAHMPVKVLGFEIKSEGIGKQCVEHAGKILDLFAVETVWDIGFSGFGVFGSVGGHG